MELTATAPDPGPTVAAAPKAPDAHRWLRVLGAVAVVGGPLGYAVGSIASPSVHETGAVTIARYAAAHPVVNGVHLLAYVLASLLLPVGTAALARLAVRRAPRLATAGGVLGVVGWLGLPASVAQDALVMDMAGRPDAGSYAGLYDRFTVDPVMTTYLLVYVVGHLLAYVLLGTALGRARLVPGWAAAAMVASSPLTVLLFVLPGKVLAVGWAALALLVIGSVPAARALLAATPAPSGRAGR